MQPDDMNQLQHQNEATYAYPNDTHLSGTAEDHITHDVSDDLNEAIDPPNDVEHEDSDIPPRNLQVSDDADVFDIYPDAGKIISKEEPAFEKIYRRQMEIGQGNIYYPFAGEKEWGVAKWLHDSGTSMAHINEFFHLKYVSILVMRS